MWKFIENYKLNLHNNILDKKDSVGIQTKSKCAINPVICGSHTMQSRLLTEEAYKSATK